MDISQSAKEFEEAKNFKELIKLMYKYFPNSTINEKIVKKIIITEKERNSLVENGFLNKEIIGNKDKDENWYSIGPNSFQLINAWKMEKLTCWIIGLTILSLVFNLILLLKTYEVF